MNYRTNFNDKQRKSQPRNMAYGDPFSILEEENDSSINRIESARSKQDQHAFGSLHHNYLSNPQQPQSRSIQKLASNSDSQRSSHHVQKNQKSMQKRNSKQGNFHGITSTNKQINNSGGGVPIFGGVSEPQFLVMSQQTANGTGGVMGGKNVLSSYFINSDLLQRNAQTDLNS